jgi:excisionase family DNA binding protein
MTEADTSPESWLTISEAAELLGVHPSTLRRWTDDGDIPAMVTPGGHRRFAQEDLERFADQQRQHRLPGYEALWAEAAMTSTRDQISDHRSAGWMTSFDEGERRRGRQLGRRLMGLMLRFVSLPECGQELLEEVEQVGRAYAAEAKSAGMELQTALEVAMFFRDSLLETTLDLPDKVNVPARSGIILLRRLNPVMNTLQLAIVAAYQEEETPNG